MIDWVKYALQINLMMIVALIGGMVYLLFIQPKSIGGINTVKEIRDDLDDININKIPDLQQQIKNSNDTMKTFLKDNDRVTITSSAQQCSQGKNMLLANGCGEQYTINGKTIVSAVMSPTMPHGSNVDDRTWILKRY